MAALLIKPLLNLWVFEDGDTKGGDDRYGDDDPCCVALALIRYMSIHGGQKDSVMALTTM